MKTLPMTLKKKWFDMIVSGEKKEEYRESKVYWLNRLLSHTFYDDNGIEQMVFKNFNTVTFKNGYAKNAPTVEVELKAIEHRNNYRNGKKEWGAVDGKHYFVLILGDIVRTENVEGISMRKCNSCGAPSLDRECPVCGNTVFRSCESCFYSSGGKVCSVTGVFEDIVGDAKDHGCDDWESEV